MTPDLSQLCYSLAHSMDATTTGVECRLLRFCASNDESRSLRFQTHRTRTLHSMYKNNQWRMSRYCLDFFKKMQYTKVKASYHWHGHFARLRPWRSARSLAYFPLNRRERLLGLPPVGRLLGLPPLGRLLGLPPGGVASQRVSWLTG